MFSRPLQLFIAICLTLLFFTSMVDIVRAITEMNIIAVISCAYLKQIGFCYFRSFSDCVRCFSCGGGLRNWEYGDGPWEEHARWFPGCTFLREQKGSDFIRQHRKVPADPDDEQDTSSTAIVSGEQALNTVKGNRRSENQSHHEDAPSAKTSNDSSKRKTESLSSEKGMSIRSIEQILLPMGFSQADIRTSLERTGKDDVRESTITRLLDDLLEHSQAQDKEQVKEHTDKTMSTIAQEPVGNLTALTANHSPSELDPKVLQEENSRLIDQLTCKICMDKESNVVFIPCGHMVSCETCAPHIRKCAICRQLIKGRVKAFMS
ncbi:baculoviral IAP repeat-containing protein 7-A-like isoform X2 [Mercenaria mercenaria]|uniref:baculoviral IAP repeat-containing protein 7-A-like isoform X2 n=1 Tax=Mercenaria mercenaria TaxID=6596 RepID=UPI00234F0703|nr:baculoviral IAP repeat-containing protein 7-A-like isoform X2 [Mercenaria mercenaria]